MSTLIKTTCTHARVERGEALLAECRQLSREGKGEPEVTPHKPERHPVQAREGPVRTRHRRLNAPPWVTDESQRSTVLASQCGDRLETSEPDGPSPLGPVTAQARCVPTGRVIPRCPHPWFLPQTHTLRLQSQGNMRHTKHPAGPRSSKPRRKRHRTAPRGRG